MSNEQKGMQLAGDLYISVLQSDNSWDAWTLVECDDLSIATPAEVAEKVSRRRGARWGQPHTTLVQPQPATFSATFTEVNRQIMAMRLAGALEAMTIAGTTLAGAEVTLPEEGWVEIGAELIDGAVTVTDGDPVDPVTYERDVDFELNPRLGFMRRLPGSAISAGATVHVSATGGTLTSHRILGNSRPRTTMRFKLDGEDRVKNRDILLWADRVMVMSTEAYNFLGADIASVPLTGRFEIPDNGTHAPFVWEYR